MAGYGFDECSGGVAESSRACHCVLQVSSATRNAMQLVALCVVHILIERPPIVRGDRAECSRARAEDNKRWATSRPADDSRARSLSAGQGWLGWLAGGTQLCVVLGGRYGITLFY